MVWDAAPTWNTQSGGRSLIVPLPNVRQESHTSPFDEGDGPGNCPVPAAGVPVGLKGHGLSVGAGSGEREGSCRVSLDRNNGAARNIHIPRYCPAWSR